MWEWLNSQYSLSLILFFSGLVLSQLCLILWHAFLKLVTKGESATGVYTQLLQKFRVPASLTVFLVFTFFALETLGPPTSLLFFLRAILMSVGIALWTLACLSSVKVVIAWIRDFSSRQSSLFKEKTFPLFELLSKIFISVGACYALLITWGVNVGAVLASAGVLGVVLGFAAKDSLSNLFSGLFIIADSPYKMGDYIQLDSGERGYITEIGMRSTRLMTRDDIEVIIPNSILANTKIINESGGHHIKERVRVNLAVCYASDIKKVKEVLLKLVEGVDGISPSPTARVRFREMGDFSLKMQLLFWIDEPSIRGRVIDEINTRIIERFREEGIVIPFPQTEMRLLNQELVVKR